MMLPRPGKPKQQKKYTDTNLYQPSIYSFKCRGIYSLSSEPALQPQHSRQGLCRGLRTSLELLADMEPCDRESAIKSFTYMTDYDLDESDANSLNQKTKSILVSPAIIYKEQGTSDESKQSTPLLEEELIKRQEWSCYGSTEVDVLVLKNEAEGTEHVAAVAPRNVGLSIRKIETEEGNISSIGIGFVNIVVDTGPILDEHGQQPGRLAGAAGATPGATRKGNRQETIAKGGDDKTNAPSPATPGVPPVLSPVSLEGLKTHLFNTFEFSKKVGEHVKHNLDFLSDTMQDDFPSRCWSAGTKIVDEIPRTARRTASYMGKMYGRWMNDEDDENGH
ncbi:hypothetical protein MPSEU_000962800 [Mayamaea pseudoterrestris]|nr:hypothetical protein MPSEU_000962800 [Mayamaea pseudoterrestris]